MECLFMWCCRSTSTDCRMRVYMNAMCLLAAACQVLCSRQRDSQRGSGRHARYCVHREIVREVVVGMPGTVFTSER